MTKNPPKILTKANVWTDPPTRAHGGKSLRIKALGNDNVMVPFLQSVVRPFAIVQAVGALTRLGIVFVSVFTCMHCHPKFGHVPPRREQHNLSNLYATRQEI